PVSSRRDRGRRLQSLFAQQTLQDPRQITRSSLSFGSTGWARGHCLFVAGVGTQGGLDFADCFANPLGAAGWSCCFADISGVLVSPAASTESLLALFLEGQCMVYGRSTGSARLCLVYPEKSRSDGKFLGLSVGLFTFLHRRRLAPDNRRSRRA